MNKRLLAVLAFACLVVGLAAYTPSESDAQQATTLRIATQAPQGSPWHRVFRAWAGSVEQESGGRLRLQFFFGGSQGDERDYAQKMEAGQLDGAAVTTVGLSHLVRPVLVLQAPGVFSEYAQMDRVRSRMGGQFQEQFHSAGYHLAGWGDVGMARFFAKQAVRRPSDLRSLRPWARPDDQIVNTFYEVIGASPQRLGINELLPGLQTGRVNAFPSSALAAVTLQWFHHATHVTRQTNGVVIGATVIRKEKYDALPADLRAIFDSTAARAHRSLTTTIRRADDQAYQAILRRGVTEVDAGAHEAEWRQAAQTTRQRLSGRLFPADLLQQVERTAGGS
jgi:TRAP-type C4-dicarboxylate transport system substrate-binding protein